MQPKVILKQNTASLEWDNTENIFDLQEYKLNIIYLAILRLVHASQFA